MATSTPGEHELLEIAAEAARAAAGVLLERFGNTAAGVHSKSTPTDLVSEADLEAETAIRELLARRRPDDAILGEEGGATGDGVLRWVVDPLDGTINYLYGLPSFSVSVACEDADGALAGVVLDPIRAECFAATRSGFPTLNGDPLAALQPRAASLDGALIATGFGYDAGVRARQADVLLRVLPRVRDVRRFGSAALDLCWTAAGRFDGYFERGVKAWDVAAGALIASRAGLEVVKLDERDGEPAGVAAGPPEWIGELRALILGP